METPYKWVLVLQEMINKKVIKFHPGQYEASTNISTSAIVSVLM